MRCLPLFGAKRESEKRGGSTVAIVETTVGMPQPFDRCIFSPVRILMPCYEYPPLGGGGRRVVDGLSRELAHEGHEVDVVTMAFRDLPLYEVIDGVGISRRWRRDQSSYNTATLARKPGTTSSPSRRSSRVSVRGARRER